MILEKLRAEIDQQLRAWAKEQGLEAAAPAALTAAPAHVDADVSLPWPMAAGKALKRKPLDVAAAVAETLKGSASVSACAPAAPGFVNMKLSPKALGENLSELLASPHLYGRAAELTQRKILIEYVSANPTGPVHLASGRAATLGDSLAKILRRRGHEVGTEYYVNDAGRQVNLLGESVKARFEGKEPPADGYQGDYIKDVAASAPKEAASWTAPQFSKFAVDQMLNQHREDMAAFGVRFDRWYLETELHNAKALDKTLDKLKKLGRVHEKEGALWLGAESDDKDRVLVRNDGRPTYFLADVAYHLDKLERGWTELIDIWGADHHGYVPRMTDAIHALGYPKGTFHPIVHQLVRLFRGQEAMKMSKRAGEFLTLRSLIEEAGLDACRFFFARHTPNAHMNFDIELAKSQTQENPVYYVQYVHARIASIFREAPAKGIPVEPVSGTALEGLTHPAERALLLKLAWFPEALRACEKELSPHPLANYLTELAGQYHSFYEACHVLDPQALDVSRARLTLCGGVRALMAESLGLLGVSAPEKM